MYKHPVQMLTHLGQYLSLALIIFKMLWTKDLFL